MYSNDVAISDVILASQYNNLRDDAITAGFIVGYGNITPPAGWLVCDGSGLDTTTYAALFAIIGYTFGGSGSTFNLPNLNTNRRLPHGKSGTRPIGTTYGNKTLSESELPTHTHTVSSDGVHTHTPNQVNGGTDSGAERILKTRDASLQSTYQSSTIGNHNHGGSTNSTGSDSEITFDPPFVAVNYIIKY